LTPLTPAAVEDRVTEGAITDEPAADAGAAPRAPLIISNPSPTSHVRRRRRPTRARRLAQRRSVTDSPFVFASRFPLAVTTSLALPTPDPPVELLALRPSGYFLFGARAK